MKKNAEDLANHEIVVIAAYLTGADSAKADTEDIAVKANEISPGRFNWRKYPAQINIDTVRKRLWDACSKEKGGYLIGSEKEGWILTEAGVQFAKSHLASIGVKKRRLSQKERVWRTTEKARLLSTEAYSKYKSGGQVSVRDAEKFFRIDTYVSREARDSKVLRLLNAFSDDSSLSAVIKHMAQLIEAGTNGIDNLR